MLHVMIAALLSSTAGFSLRAPLSSQSAAALSPRRGRVLLVDGGGDDFSEIQRQREEAAKLTKSEDDALAAAFAARLDKEGGATQFKIKTSVTGAADTVKDTLSPVTSAIKNVEMPSADGVLNASPTQLLGGLFAVVLVATLISAGGRAGQVDTYTSDGTTLEFGQRSEYRDVPLNAYRPEYGRQ